MPRDHEAMLESLAKETGLTGIEARFYFALLGSGSVPAGERDGKVEKLLAKGMIILSGDNSRYIPVHPRLAIANQYRTWRESMVREINERRLRVDRLILELIPVYEATTEKRLADGR